MTQPWFRLQRGTVHNPKAQKLPDRLFKAWINLLCCTDDDGFLPPIDDLAFILRAKVGAVRASLVALEAAGLLVHEGEDLYRAHDWSEHQRKSDTSNERVKAHRERKKVVTGNVTPDVTGNGHRRTEEKLEREREAVEARLRSVAEALSLSPDPKTWPQPWWGLAAKLEGWISGGADFRAHVLAACREMASKPANLSKGAGYLGAIVTRLQSEQTTILPSSSGADPRAPETDAKAFARLEAHERGEWFREAWGAPPGESGCLISAEQLAAFRSRRAA